MDSQRETLRNLLVTEFAKINGTGDYRTEVKTVLPYRPFAMENHPSVVVEVVEEEINFIDSNKNTANSQVRVRIWGHYKDEIQGADIKSYAAETAGEPLLHDIKRVLRTLMIRDVHAANSPRFQLLDPIIVRGPEYTATNVGWVMVECRARILYQGADW